ncbi:MAG: imidazole glycerol phosphate synthase subunit HisH [Bacteroidia bacterium]|nr:imidazole glycerol phosphate synthase subunit HisH [Bacteroidia bacterium]
MKKIGIIDYGVGNIRSVRRAFEAIGVETELVSTPGELKTYQKIVLPGVGAFAPAIDALRNKGFDIAIPNFLATKENKLLGLCLGMQLLFESSSEGGKNEGLKILKGEVRSIEELGLTLMIPHMGWNEVKKIKGQGSRLLEHVENPCFYFVHSYYCKPSAEITGYHTNYGQEFVSALETENILACQFHPEKSHDAGLQVLKNFSEW